MVKDSLRAEPPRWHHLGNIDCSAPDKLAENYLAALKLVAIRIWLRG
jgi:transposase